jgi:hypothetical protein
MARWKYVILKPVYVAFHLRFLTSANTKKSYSHFVLYTGNYCIPKSQCLIQVFKLLSTCRLQQPPGSNSVALKVVATCSF